MLKNFTTLELREDDVLTTAGFWSMIVSGLELLMLENWDCEIHLTCLDDGASEDSPFEPDTTRSQSNSSTDRHIKIWCKVS